MRLEYFGRKQLVNALSGGWSPVPGYEYAPGEWAFLLMQDGAQRSCEAASLIAGEIARPEARVIWLRRPHKKPKRVTHQIRKAVLQRLANGERQFAIAMAYNLSQSTVSNINLARS